MTPLTQQQVIAEAARAAKIAEVADHRQTEAVLDARHEARKVLRKYRNGALAGFVVLTLGIGAAFHESYTSRERISSSGTTIARQFCDRQNKGFMSITAIFADAQTLTNKSKVPQTAEQRQLTKEFYARAFAHLAPIPCDQIAVTK